MAGCANPDAKSDAPSSAKPVAKTSPAASKSRTAAAAAATAQRIDFNTHIRPILNQNCVACHGGVKAAGEISFIYRDAATKIGKKSGRHVIVPGDPDASEMIKRVSSPDKDYRMPPAEHGPALQPGQIALLREWIKQGAEWQDHWAFVPPRAQTVPVMPVISKQSSSSLISDHSSAIDAFIRARLAKEKLTPSPEATRPALLRRASFDLTGLPPTPEEIAAFVADPSADAYEKQIDRLLASPRFGERWASHWLDLARYADTKGYEKDEHRNVWQYRDWVVDALNRNLPYDQFVIEQLAGDLLPSATPAQHIATGFHRQTQVNDEGGTDDEEYRTAAVLDRVATTWQVTGAVTFGCVQCHSHPYDPIRHREFYQFLAFFNSTRDADFNNEYPTLHVPDDRARFDEAWQLRREIESLRHEVIAPGKTLEAESAQWSPLAITTARATPEANVTVRDGMLNAEGTIAANARYELTAPIPALSVGPITAVRFEAPPINPDVARYTPERGFIVTQLEIALSRPDGSVTPLSVGRFFPDTYSLETIATKALTPPTAAGEAPATAKKKRGAKVVERVAQSESAPSVAALPSQAPVESPAPPAKPAPAPKPRPEDMRDITLDFHFAANPTLNRPRWIVAALREPIVAPAGSELRITVVHSRQITEKPAPVRRLRVAASTDPRWNALARDPEMARKSARVTEALAELAKIPGTDLPVMTELPPGEGRETRLFVRGNFLEKTGEPLAPGVPALFPPLPANAPRNRLTLARWFFQPGQPLTARVAVNRFWEQLFGSGIVPTVEDFGSAGEWPTHPELLDWLALHFERDLHWNIKALLREIVLSATYRQDARVTPALFERDPQNRLLARGPRQRLTAEMVRDQALAASGLLSAKMGGAPVMPPQPPGVWQTVYNSREWVESKGEDRHRRAVYTYWKRSAAYPSFLTFDMPARDLCTARRTPTNTPLQALVTLNDVVYDEAAAALAQRALSDAGENASPDAWIARAFERVISRTPTATELARLQKLYETSLASPAQNDPAARARRDVAAAILNLDAAFVR
jgi:mono/diheme cytochrome c family protein